MNLYLMRHAHALDIGEEGIRRDFDRPLSGKGQDITREVASALKTIGIKLDLIGTSPLLRARQTAEIVASELGGIPVDRCPMMAPNGSLSELIQWLRRCGFESVMLVGHMPDLAELASTLICGQPAAGVIFKKAAVCRITFDTQPAAGKGALEWLLPPAIMTRLD